MQHPKIRGLLCSLGVLHILSGLRFLFPTALSFEISNRLSDNFKSALPEPTCP